jgi:lipid II:glycine glycyltransferase (peptidoglycan interpeptide bridge formation enzyme)
VSGAALVAEAQAWDATLASMPRPHLLQSYRWGELQSRFGWQAERHFIDVGDTTVPVSLLITPTLVPGARYGYVGKGPALAAPQLNAALEPLAMLAHSHGLAFLTIEPEVEKGWMPPRPWCRATATQPEHTSIIDLRPEPEAILAGLKSKTRYNVRLAQKRGVVVAASDDVAAFAELAEMTSARHRIQLAREPYYGALHGLMAADGTCRLYLAHHEGKPLAGIMVVRFAGRATYLFGASAPYGRSLMPAYLLHWHAIQEMRSLGDVEYDLWGIPPDDQPRHPWSGLWQFKSGWNGRLVTYAGAFDLPRNVTVWRGHRALARMRSTVRRVRSGLSGTTRE